MEEETRENQPAVQAPVAVEERKVNPPTIVILLIAILLVGVGGVYAGIQIGKRQTTPQIPPQANSPTSTPTPYKTVDQETFIDRVYGFQIKIPQNWYVYPTGGSKGGKVFPGDTFTASTYDIYDQRNFDAKSTLLDTVENSLQLQIVISTDGNKTLEQEKTELISKVGKGLEASQCKITQVIDYSLDSRPAIKTIFECDEKSAYQISLIGNKNYFYRIVLSGGIVTSSNQILIDQILSTFKFLPTISPTITAAAQLKKPLGTPIPTPTKIQVEKITVTWFTDNYDNVASREDTQKGTTVSSKRYLRTRIDCYGIGDAQIKQIRFKIDNSNFIGLDVYNTDYGSWSLISPLRIEDNFKDLKTGNHTMEIEVETRDGQIFKESKNFYLESL